MPQINLRVDEETARRLQYLSARTGRSKTFYATEALTQYLDEKEDYLLAKDALEEFTQSNDATWEDRRIHGTLQGSNN